MKSMPRSRQKPLKTIRYLAARPRKGDIREYPPQGAQITVKIYNYSYRKMP